MKYQETLNTQLSNGRSVKLDCSCSAIGTVLMDFNVFIKDGTKLEDCELEECNNIARNWAMSAVLSNCEEYYG